MIAYKFLGSDCTGRFSGFAWPLPDGGSSGAWVGAPPSRCASGVHACRVRDLPFWIDATLWRIELAGPVEEASRKVVAGRGRLLEPIDAWDADVMRDFGLACAERIAPLAGGSAALQGYATDAVTFAETGKGGVAGFVAARAAELAGGVDEYEAERTAQVAWLAEQLSLAT